MLHYLMNAFFLSCNLHSPPITMSVYLILLLKNSHQCISLHLSPLITFPHSNLNTQGKTSEVKVTQSCLTTCDRMDYTVHGILQARILEWVAVPSPGDLPNPGIEPNSALQAGSLPTEPSGMSSFCLKVSSYGGSKAQTLLYLLPCLSKREKGKGTLSYKSGCHHIEPYHSGCESTQKYKQARVSQSPELLGTGPGQLVSRSRVRKTCVQGKTNSK